MFPEIRHVYSRDALYNGYRSYSYAWRYRFSSNRSCTKAISPKEKWNPSAFLCRHSQCIQTGVHLDIESITAHALICFLFDVRIVAFCLCWLALLTIIHLYTCHIGRGSLFPRRSALSYTNTIVLWMAAYLHKCMRRFCNQVLTTFSSLNNLESLFSLWRLYR